MEKEGNNTKSHFICLFLFLVHIWWWSGITPGDMRTIRDTGNRIEVRPRSAIGRANTLALRYCSGLESLFLRDFPRIFKCTQRWIFGESLKISSLFLQREQVWNGLFTPKAEMRYRILTFSTGTATIWGMELRFSLISTMSAITFISCCGLDYDFL